MAYENEVYLNSAHETCSELFLSPHICTPTRSHGMARVVVDIIEERKLLSGEKGKTHESLYYARRPSKLIR